MVDIGVALTWIAISAASAKGLSAFARATAMSETENELASLTVGDSLASTGSGPHAIDLHPRPLGGKR
jgi:hypothetical protein